MIWLLRFHDRIVYRGTYQGALTAAERAGALYHVEAIPKGDKVEHVMVPGRWFAEDGTELASRLDRGWSIMPAAQSARRAAA
jgi:hypothetical protein